MARRRATGFLRDFQEFIKQGNVVDLAVAVILGGAFSQIVDAVVTLATDAILNPTLDNLGVENIKALPAGNLLVATLNFLIIAFVIFLIIKALERFRREEAAAAEPDPQPQLADAVNRLATALENRQL